MVNIMDNDTRDKVQGVACCRLLVTGWFTIIDDSSLTGNGQLVTGNF